MYEKNTDKQSKKVENEHVKFVLDGSTHSFKTLAASSWNSLKMKIVEELSRCVIVRLSIYCAEVDNLNNYRKELNDLFPSMLPAIEFLAQTPLDDVSFVAISWGYKDYSRAEIALDHSAKHWKVVSATITDGVDNSHQNMQEALHDIESQLNKYGFNYKDVIRTWIYVGEITHFSNGVENYEAINLSRKNYYDRIFGPKTLSKYPASTGIGMDNRDIVISALAYRKRPFEEVSPVENIAQTAAWNYPSHLAKISPTFSRAYRINTPSGTLSLISGTASIIGAETVHIGDVQAQVGVTIDNLERVIAGCIRQPDITEPLSTVIQYVCYIKNPSDLEKVRQICYSRLPLSANRLFVKADVCRDNLLVEIEAVTYEAL